MRIVSTEIALRGDSPEYILINTYREAEKYFEQSENNALLCPIVFLEKELLFLDDEHDTFTEVGMYVGDRMFVVMYPCSDDILFMAYGSKKHIDCAGCHGNIDQIGLQEVNGFRDYLTEALFSEPSLN